MTTDGKTPGGLPFDLGMIMNKAQELQKQLADQHKQAETIEAIAKAGGGMVSVTANGAGKVLRIDIEPALIATGDKEMLEDLTAAAVNKALADAREQAKAQMSKLTGGMQLPLDRDSVLG